jgi:hypothetical protein
MPVLNAGTQAQVMVASIDTGSSEDLEHNTIQGKDQPGRQIGGKN